MLAAVLSGTLPAQMCSAVLQEATRLEQEQEQKLKEKYGGMKPKKRLIPKARSHAITHACLPCLLCQHCGGSLFSQGPRPMAHAQEKKVFDSADWQLAKQGKPQEGPPNTPLAPRLAPKSSGSQRRASHLADDE